MRLFKLCSLGVAIFAVTATSSSASADFLNDSSFDIKLRNVHFDLNVDDPNTTEDGNWSQWAQGIEANFKSGYFADVIGFDASYYGAIKLDHSGNSYSRFLH